MVVARGPPDEFTLDLSDFPREFAEFVTFIGPDELQSSLRRVEQKLASTSPEVRKIYGDRYYFHAEFDKIQDRSRAFQPDTSDIGSVRAASFVAGVNRIRRGLSPDGASHLRAMVLDNLKPQRDIRQIEHEIRCWTHFGRKGFETKFAELEKVGNFDLLVRSPTAEIEVECKTIAGDTGGPLKADLGVTVSDSFLRTIDEMGAFAESGIFEVSLFRPAPELKQLGQRIREVLLARSEVTGGDLSIRFVPRPAWQSLFDEGRRLSTVAELCQQPGSNEDVVQIVRTADAFIGLTILGHKPPQLAKIVTTVLKKAADQCSGARPAVLWLHFLDMDLGFFEYLAKFSSDGSGNGLNAIVARVIKSESNRTDRSHVKCVRFSASPTRPTTQMVLQPNLLFANAASAGGLVYEVPVPACKFAGPLDI